MPTQSMRAIRVHRYGDADQLKLEHIQRPEPQAGEVLVQVHAAGVNPIDWKIRQGLRKDILQMQFPYIPGMEIAGVVQEVGHGVTALQVGQAVYGRSMKGGYMEVMCRCKHKIKQVSQKGFSVILLHLQISILVRETLPVTLQRS